MGLPSTGKSRAQRTAAAPRVEGRETLARVLTPADWNGCFKKQQAWPEAQDADGAAGRLCREVPGKAEIREGKQSSFLLVNHFTLKDTSVAVKGLNSRVTTVPVFAAHSDS